MEERIPTEQEIAQTISAARDSVWVINDEMSKENIIAENVKAVQRNVAHLDVVMSIDHVTDSGEDLSDITAAITAGNAFLEQHNALLED